MEVVAEVTQCTRKDVFASGIKVEGYIGQTFAQSQLVDISLLRLPHSLIVDILQLLQYVLYRTAAIETQRKVAASDCRMGRIAACEYVKRDSFGCVCFQTVAHNDVADDSTGCVIYLKVARQDVGAQ